MQIPKEMDYTMPTLVSESTSIAQASHLKIVLTILEGDLNEDKYKDILTSIVILIVAEREVLPVLLFEHILNGEHLATFSYNKNLCDDVAKEMNTLLEIVRQQKSTLVWRLQMGHIASDLSFVVLVANYGKRQFKITFISTRTTSNTKSFVFDMGKCVTFEDDKIQLDYRIIKEFSHRVSDSLLYPILTEWWQDRQLYSHLPYILGIPEECILKISQCFRRPDANNLRMTSRRMNIVPKRIY